MYAADAQTDARFMRRAIRLAMNGRGSVEPNPMVGCVVVRAGRVIGEGYHERYGGPHAEPNALAACAAAGESPEGATAYVTLEPCCHTNKKTPPCAPKLIEAKLARVVVGCLDPNPDVNGKGLAMLGEARIAVDGPMLEHEAKQLIAPFIARLCLRRPYVTLKWAQTADAKVAGARGARLQISNQASTRLVHQLRANSDAVLIGITTATTDDPLLTARDVAANRQPARVVLDSGLNLSLKSRLVATARDAPLWVFCSDPAFRAGGNLPERVEAMKARGASVSIVEADPRGGVSLRAVLEELHTARITNLLVEPGPTLARSFLEDALVDRLWVFRSPRSINEETAPAAASVSADLVVTGELGLGDDRLTEYLNHRGDAYFAPVPSPDFMLAAAAPATPAR
jgi:diaminohydroxyphosphoribosylaminopyrimidine deaminase/5-amino-6-(5-phosphoribosylamino)uracil reductase